MRSSSCNKILFHDIIRVLHRHYSTPKFLKKFFKIIDHIRRLLFLTRVKNDSKSNPLLENRNNLFLSKLAAQRTASFRFMNYV